MTTFDPSIAWPSGSIGVLVEAAYHSDPNIASEKWECWKQNSPDLDTLDWQTARLLAQAATILFSRGIESTDLATQKIIRRFEWTLGDNQFQNVRPLLDAAARAGIPIMAFKGAAMHVSGFADSAPRLMADVDILIEPAQIDNVMDVAESLGWNSKWPLSRTAFKDCLLSSRHSVPLANGGISDIDLHTSAFLLNRCPDHDASMWARSTEARIRDVTVLVPSALDMLIVTLGHGLLFSRPPMAIWVGDTIALIENGVIDWDIFLEEIERRDLAVFAYTGLAFISQELGRSVPEPVLTKLASQLREPFLSEFLGHVKAAHATSRTFRQSWGAAASIRAKKWRSRMKPSQSIFPVAASSVPIKTEWRNADRSNATTFTVGVPEELHQVSGQCILEIKLIGDVIRSPNRMSAALTCFDYHICELDHWDFTTERFSNNNSSHDQRIQFRIDTAIISAYSLRKFRLELLAPDTLDASPISVDAVKYRWVT